MACLFRKKDRNLCIIETYEPEEVYSNAYYISRIEIGIPSWERSQLGFHVSVQSFLGCKMGVGF